MQLHFGFCTVDVAFAVAVAAGARHTPSGFFASFFVVPVEADPCGVGAAEATAMGLVGGGGGGVASPPLTAETAGGIGDGEADLVFSGAALFAQPTRTSARSDEESLGELTP